MARFYASIQGNRGEASRMGTPASGIHGHIRGWNVGARVACYTVPDGTDDDADAVSVSLSQGSSGGRSYWPVAYAEHRDGETTIRVLDPATGKALGEWIVGREGRLRQSATFPRVNAPA